MFQMCGVFAEFERAIIVERLARAKAKDAELAAAHEAAVSAVAAL